MDVFRVTLPQDERYRIGESDIKCGAGVTAEGHEVIYLEDKSM